MRIRVNYSVGVIRVWDLVEVVRYGRSHLSIVDIGSDSRVR